MNNKALGKGLSALIPEKDESSQQEVAFIKTSLIIDNKLQPRTDYNKEKLNELIESIRDQGVLQPILVRQNGDNYEVVAGERRLKAARELGLDEVPVIIKTVNDQESLVIALVENIQREELNPIEEAEAYRKLIEDFQFTQEDVAHSVAKNRSTISNFIRLLKLPSDIKAGLYSGDISMGHARALLSVESPIERKKLYDETIKKDLSVRELENLAKKKDEGPARREKGVKTKSDQVLALEEGLQKILGTKVRIESKQKRGKIVVDYYSTEELERIIKLIIKQ